MFLNVWKRKSIKRNLESLLDDLSSIEPTTDIKLVGILVEYPAFKDFEKLRKMTTNLGPRVNCKILCYVSKLRNAKDLHEDKFDSSGFTWKGKVTDGDIIEFTDKPFDLLISYYKTDNLFLHYVTALAKTGFRVGFPLEESRLNNLSIIVDMDNVDAFEVELKKYLKILTV